MSFSNKLKELRTKKGISQAKLAEEIFVSRSAVAKWENSLGLPNDESLKLLADYFEVSIDELLTDKENEQIVVSKNQTIDNQHKIIIGLTVLCCIILLILAYIFIIPIRDSIGIIILGIYIILLGVFNLQGNIASIHWYNRRKVTKENQIPYARLHGFSCVIIGISMIIASIVQSCGFVNLSGSIALIGIAIGLGLMLYAQFKYNKGIF